MWNFSFKIDRFCSKIGQLCANFTKELAFCHNFLPLQCSLVQSCNFLPLQCTIWTMKNLPLRAERLVGHFTLSAPPPGSSPILFKISWSYESDTVSDYLTYKGRESRLFEFFKDPISGPEQWKWGLPLLWKKFDIQNRDSCKWAYIDFITIATSAMVTTVITKKNWICLKNNRREKHICSLR